MKPKKPKFEVSEEQMQRLAKDLTEAGREMGEAIRKAGADVADQIRCPARAGPIEFSDGARCEKMRGHPGEHQFEKARKPRCEYVFAQSHLQCTRRQGHQGPHI